MNNKACYLVVTMITRFFFIWDRLKQSHILLGS